MEVADFAGAETRRKKFRLKSISVNDMLQTVQRVGKGRYSYSGF